VYNEASHLRATLAALLRAVERSTFDTEIVVVDDGSTDDSADVARAAVGDQLPLRVIAQPNRGRFEARRAGLEAARSEWALLLDGRVQIDAEALAYVEPRLGTARVWTSHVDIDANGDPLADFWKLIAELAWSDYFDDPRETSFGGEDFDRFPKGTTCFLAPRSFLLDAVDAFRSRYADVRQANDDTPVLRWMAEREPMHVSPGFRSLYRPRTTLGSFFRHSVHRGVVFVDGHGRPESRFFPAVVAFFPASLVLGLVALRRPAVVPAALAAAAVLATAFGIARGRSGRELASLALVTPVYGVAHGIGMWRGLVTIVRQPPAGGARP
jgi:glycosyltransferase involved in cell wall biosynthesis